MIIRLIEPIEEQEDVKEYAITKDEFLIGRGTECDLRLNESDVSRQHCQLKISNNEITLVDLGSSNGTIVNGERIRDSVALHHADVVKIGVRVFLVQIGDQRVSDLQQIVDLDANASTLQGFDRDSPGPGKPMRQPRGL
jgi:pSer/pThr/pTyr-binding forkhead associated (FHA) protein